MNRHLVICLLVWSVSLCHAQNIERAWDMVWSRFYLPKVQTFGDYLSTYEKGKEQAHLPMADEVRRQYPNPCGYSTGMEDGAILGGAMLSVLCDRFEVTKDKSLREKAASVFSGLKRCATAHGAGCRMCRHCQRLFCAARLRQAIGGCAWMARAALSVSY